MKTIESVFVNGQFRKPHGTQVVKIISPLNEEGIAQIIYADEQDTLLAIEAANAALPAFAVSTKTERIAYLNRISIEIEARIDDLINATILEYGAPNERAKWANLIAATTFANQAKLLEDYAFTRQVNESTVVMEPVGVSSLFTPWNAVAGSIAIKVAAAIAAGCTVILKPSEFGAWQAQIIMECIAAAGLPAGVVNMINGDGATITKPIMESADVTKISFTGSTVVGKLLARQAVETMKRVTLELGGKSANIILEDADLNKAIPMALQAAFMNNGQACIAGTRLLVPESRIDEVKNLLVREAGQFVVGNPSQVNSKHLRSTAESTLTLRRSPPRKRITAPYRHITISMAAGMRSSARILTGSARRSKIWWRSLSRRLQTRLNSDRNEKSGIAGYPCTGAP